MSTAPKKALTREKKISIGFAVLRYLIVFLVPLITGIVIFKKKEIAPFGNNDVLSIDLWGQYFPMYRKFAFDSGISEAMYNWSGALGFNNWVQNAFYCRSIFLIPFQFISTDNSITYIDIVCLLRFGLGALACQAFLEYKFKSRNPIIMATSICYGLCAYSTAFIMQFMWTDGLFLAPLVLLGLERLIRGKSPAMYTLMLAFTIYTNFYTGFGVCLFTGFYFVAYWLSKSYTGKDGSCLTVKENLKARGKLFGRFMLYSVLGGVATAVVLVPTVKGLSNSESANEGVLNFSQWYHTMAENAASMLPETPASLEFGVPNIAVGLFAFILIPLFFLNAEIKFAEKLAAGGFLGLLYAGLNYNPMDWLFNGFHFPNQLPGRWSFLFSFAITIVAANGLAKAKGIKVKSVITSLIIGMFFVVYAKYGNLDSARLDKLGHWNLLLAVFAGLMILSIGFSFFSEKLADKASAAEKSETETKTSESAENPAPKADKLRKSAFALKACAFTTSIVIAAVVAIQSCQDTVDVAAKEGAGIPISDMDSFNKVSDVIYDFGQKHGCGKDEFYRMEAYDGWTFNTSMIGDFNGIGYYGSTLNYGVYQLLKDMGNRVYANNVSSVYNTTSLFQNSLFGIKYVLDRSRIFLSRSGQGYNIAEDGENGIVWENPTALPIAFGASNNILDFKVDPNEIRPIATQNEMLNRIWGQPVNVFEHSDPSEFTYENCEFAQNDNWNENYFYRTDSTLPVNVTWTYVVQNEDPLYFEQNFRAGTLLINDTEQVDIGAERFRCLGSYPAGTVLQFKYNCSDVNIGCFGFDLYSFNMTKWNEVYNGLSSSGLEVTSFKNTDIKGKLNAPQSEMVFTSIPQDGGWKVYVDGKKVEDFKALGTLIAFTVDAGEHDIEFKYHVPAFTAGLLMTIVALLMLAVCCYVFRAGGIKNALGKLSKPAKQTAVPASEKTPEADEKKTENSSDEKTAEDKQ